MFERGTGARKDRNYNWLCQDEEIWQPRMQWYGVEGVARRLVVAGSMDHIPPQNMIFIGGIATYLHAKNVVGNQVTNGWRGTHDIDLVILQSGAPTSITTNLSRQGYFSTVEAVPSHFKDKNTIKLVVPPNGSLTHEERRMDVDLYYPRGNTMTVNLNNRILRPSPHPFIKETAVKTTLNGQTISIPSVVDCMIMKLDIAVAVNKLRGKDTIDIMTLIKVAENSGKTSKEVIDKILSAYSGNAYGIVLIELKNMFEQLSQCECDGKIPDKKRKFLPSGEAQRSYREILRIYETQYRK